MSLNYYIVLTRAGISLSAALQAAARARIEVVESTARCEIFTSKLDGIEYRLIGAMSFPSGEPAIVWTRSGCTSSDIAALLRFGATNTRRGLSAFPSKSHRRIDGQALGVRLVRPLSDYGDDLHLVVAIPETIPASLGAVEGLHEVLGVRS